MRDLTTPTFVIGLGGLGNAILRHLHTRFLTVGRGQLPPTVKLRSIDTAAQLRDSSAPELPPSMFTLLPELRANLLVDNPDTFPEIHRWWRHYPPDCWTPGLVKDGAAARRPVGRLFFFQYIREIYEALRDDFVAPLSQDLQRRMTEQGLDRVKKTPRVFIVGSLAGGTCAGLFIDTALVVRHLLQQVGYDPEGIRITGAFGLPSVIDVAAGGSESQEAKNRRITAWGALSEIEALQKGWRPGELVIDYREPVGRLQPRPPFLDHVYLFTRTTRKGYIYQDQREILLRAAHFLYGQIALDVGERLGQVEINRPGDHDPSERTVTDGLLAIYASFGVEWLEIPRRALVQAWSQEVGTTVAVRVLGPQKPGGRGAGQFRERFERLLADRLPVVKRVYGLAGKRAESVAELPGLAGLADAIDGISTARKAEELEKRLREFQSDVPSLVRPFARTLEVLHSEADEITWVREALEELADDPDWGFRGAAELFANAQEVLGKALEPAKRPAESLDEVVKESLKGFLLKKVQPEPALDWARRLAWNVLKEQVRAVAGDRVDAFRTRLGRLARELEQFVGRSETVARNLAERIDTKVEVPREMWLLDPEDIYRTISENQDEVVEEVSRQLLEAMRQHVLEVYVEGTPLDRLAETFGRVMVMLLEQAVVKRTKRPADAAMRLVDRVKHADPLVRVDDQTELIHELLGPRELDPIRVVLTDLREDKRRELEQVLHEQVSRDVRVHESGDMLRDDAVHLTFGWPLWLLPEARECAEERDKGLEAGNVFARFNKVLMDWEPAKASDPVPPGRGESEKWFALAWVLGFIRRKEAGRVFRFDDEVFPQAPEVKIAEDETNPYEKAFGRFRQYGLARRMVDWAESKVADDGDAFREKIRQAIESRKKQVAEAAAEGAISGEVQRTLERYVDLVEEYRRTIILSDL